MVQLIRCDRDLARERECPGGEWKCARQTPPDHHRPPEQSDMNKITSILLLLLGAAAAKQDFGSSKYVQNDQEVSNDQVTSILVHPGPDGPRHVILSNDHQIISSSSAISSSVEGASSRVANTNYNYPSASYSSQRDYHQTIPPPLTQATYGPARPVTFRHARPVQQLYHNRFRQTAKIPHQKVSQDEAIYKYSTYIKHDKIKDFGKNPEKGYYLSNYEKPDYSVTAEREPSQKPQSDGLSKYRSRDEEEEIKFRESIGDLYNHNSFEKSNDYTEKKRKPLVKQNYVSNVDYIPNKNYQSAYNTFDEEPYHDAPSGFDDHNGGKVVPVLARFYKQPLPIIQTQLPADNVGLYVQYFPHHRSDYDKEEVSNYYDYPQKLNLKRDSSSSEWTPINAPDGAVPAKAYDIPAPDLSLAKPRPASQKVYRRGSEEASVVVGKIATSSQQHIQGNSEGVVSAVVRVKQ